MRHNTPSHPLEHHPSYRAVIAAAPRIAALGNAELVTMLATACADLASGFASPPGSKQRAISHHRAWQGIRTIDRLVQRAIRVRDPLQRKRALDARHAIDRADVFVGALPGVQWRS